MGIKHRTIQLEAVADTGTQTTTAGEDILRELGCSDNQLLCTKHRLRSVNDDHLSIKGALVTTISLGDEICSETIYICPRV